MGTCGKKDKNFCVIAVVENTNKIEDVKTKLKDLCKEYESDNIACYYIKQFKMNTSIWSSKFEKSKILIVRGKRNKYLSLIESITKIGLAPVKDKIDYLLGGNLRNMKKYSSLDSLLS